jgi:hypothetical protein
MILHVTCHIGFFGNLKNLKFLVSGHADTCITLRSARHCTARNTIQYGTISISENNMA